MCFNIRNIHSFQLVLVLCMHPNFTTTPLIIAHRRRRTCFTIALFLVWILFCVFFFGNKHYIHIYSDSIRRERISVAWDWETNFAQSCGLRFNAFTYIAKQSDAMFTKNGWKPSHITIGTMAKTSSIRKTHCEHAESNRNWMNAPSSMAKEIDKIKTDAEKRKDSTIVSLHPNSTLATFLFPSLLIQFFVLELLSK